MINGVPDPKVRSVLCSLTAIAKFKQDKTARKYVWTMGNRSGFEHLLCYCGATGKVFVRRSDRQVDRVGLSRKCLAHAKSRGGRLVVHHNHPRDMSLSLVDIKHLVSRPGTAEMFAHGHDGSWYWAESCGKRDGLDMIGHGDTALFKAVKKLYERNTPLNEVCAPHIFNRALDKAGIIVYKYELSPSMSATMSQISDQLMSWLVDYVCDAIRKERR